VTQQLATQPGPRRRQPGHRGPNQRWLIAVGIGLVLAFAAVAWVQWRQISLLSDTVRYEGDNLTWSFFQLESEYLQLRDGLREARRGSSAGAPLEAATASALRQRFELFASRLSLVGLERTARFAEFGAGHTRLLDQLTSYIKRHDGLLAEAASSTLTAAALAPALAELGPLFEPIHDLSLQANQVIAEQVGRRNDAVRDQTRLGIGLTLFQCLLTLAFAAITARQFRALRERRQQLQGLADHLQQTRQEADAARLDAEAASQAKSAFLANMSHELRTPFNGMLGMLALLESSRLDAEQADHVRTARESAKHLLDLLNDILDISKLESGRLDIAPHPVDLHRLIGEVQVLMLMAAQAKGLGLTVTVAPEVPDGVVVDGKRLKQILFNLMSNAVKFTDRGVVSLAVRLASEAAPAAPAGAPPADSGSSATGNPVALRFAVSDTGVGISDEVLTRLFQRFTQGDASTSRRYGGSGLGLEISRSLARLMGGDIEVHSLPGNGATFTLALTLPACEPETIWTTAEPVGTQTGDTLVLDLLVADDHPVNRKFMAALLGRMGHRVRLASNGVEAVAAVQQRPPDLVFMDLHMPVQDGLEATRLLRALPAPMGQVPIVALTADVFSETRARVSAAGMNHFLCKPVQPEAIAATLAQLFGDRARAQLPAANPAASGDAEPTDRYDRPAQPSAHVTEMPVSQPAAPAAPVDSTASPRRFSASDVATHLDMVVIGDVCVGISLDGYRQLLGGFLSDDAASINRLLRALEAGNHAELPALAHAVRGAAASLGLRAIHALGREVEQHGVGYDAAHCQASAAQLREQVRDARALCARMGFL